MPVHNGVDSNGPYFQYGEHGKKYYYDTKLLASYNTAHNNAVKQGQAIHAHGGY